MEGSDARDVSPTNQQNRCSCVSLRDARDLSPQAPTWLDVGHFHRDTVTLNEVAGTLETTLERLPSSPLGDLLVAVPTIAGNRANGEPLEPPGWHQAPRKAPEPQHYSAPTVHRRVIQW